MANVLDTVLPVSLPCILPSAPYIKVNLLPPVAAWEGELRSRIPSEEVEVRVGECVFRLIRPSDIDGLIQKAKEEDELPFWAYLWPASLAIADYFHSMPSSGGSTPVRALELGTGLGLAGIAAARLLGWEVVQTDLMEKSLRFARINALRNGLTLPGFVADWRSFGTRCRFEVIFASDILYEPMLHPALLKVVQAHLRPGGRFLVSDPYRVYGLKFMAHLEDLGWTVTTYDPPLREEGTPVLIYEALSPQDSPHRAKDNADNSRIRNAVGVSD